MAKNEETALATTAMDYAIMQHSAEDLSAIISANIGNRPLGPGDLDRIKVPSGGGTTWEIPSLDGEISSKHLDGIIAAWKEPRAYWAESLSATGGGQPPDCSSEDGMVGIGNPGGACDACPFSKFGSAVGDDGKSRDGQACRQMRLMAIVQKDDLVPVLLSAPATSLQGLTRYFLRLSSRGVPFYGVVTRFTLVKERSKGGIEYSRIEANSIERLSDEHRAQMASFSDLIGKSLERRTVYEQGEYE